ncbi:putative inorganic carbon transporter subunit DabA [Pseudoalteromonas sp. H105]|jgi:uncharacterized protein YbcC (UPF0753/DUF2309 family)|uniref:putative inorganic carbon transporter subunit DabA n=1 Tax=Pseudoalteromonas sp. H105 TaxID=1348393 RepID=UPI00191019BD|nr:putative inorganic carbon transporter subunit DabA [Pseudoalteromonas sp. H105]
MTKLTVLNAMGLTEYAENILLEGHGSQSANNLHAAGLDCCACGGQIVEVNVRILASLLNEPKYAFNYKAEAAIAK